MSFVYPHDPRDRGGDGAAQRDSGCAICDEPWPCAERQRQRKVIREIVDYIATDLYEPQARKEPGKWWRSPLGWEVHVSYGEKGVPVQIKAPDGKVYANTDEGSFEWIRDNLP